MKTQPRPKLPSPETLAQIAATLVASGQAPDVAVENAFDLWQKASRKLDPAYQAELAGVKAIADKVVGEAVNKELGNLPAQWPATLGDFLTLVVKAKTPADATNRLRHFLCERERRLCVPQRYVWGEDTPEDKAEFEQRKQRHENRAQRYLEEHPRFFEDKACERLAKYGERGIDRAEWLPLREDYLQWWAGQKSVQNSKGGKKRAENKRALAEQRKKLLALLSERISKKVRTGG